MRRPDAAWLRTVLGGRYSYDELVALVADLRRELAQAAASSSLPAEPDVALVEALVVDLQRRALGDARFDPHDSLGAARGLSFSRGEFSADSSLPEG